MKRKKSDAVDEVAATYEDLVHTAAERVGPIAQAAADKLEAAAGRVGPLAHDAAERLEPLAQKAADKVAPFAQQAQDFVSPYAQQAADKVGPLAQQVGGTVGPYALLAKQRGAQAAHDVIEKWRPTLEEAMERISPGVEAARDRINEDLLPKLIAALEAAAAAPVVVEAGKRGQATLAAAKGELTLPEPKPKRRWLKRVLIIAVVGGVVVVVARRLLGGQDADWQAARPTAPYAPPKPPTPPAPASNGQTQDTVETLEPPAPEAAVPEDVVATPEAEQAIVPEESSAEQTPEEATAADGAAPGEPGVEEPRRPRRPRRPRSTGRACQTTRPTKAWIPTRSRTGRRPRRIARATPARTSTSAANRRRASSIKANERSMKYHVPESAGYQPHPLRGVVQQRRGGPGGRLHPRPALTPTRPLTDNTYSSAGNTLDSHDDRRQSLPDQQTADQEGSRCPQSPHPSLPKHGPLGRAALGGRRTLSRAPPPRHGGG